MCETNNRPEHFALSSVHTRKLCMIKQFSTRKYPTWITRMLSPVSCANCSLMCRVGLGVAAKAAFKVSNCFALIVVLGPRRLAPMLLSEWSPVLLVISLFGLSLTLLLLLFLLLMLLVMSFVVPLPLLLFVGIAPAFGKPSTLLEKFMMASSFTSSGLPRLDETELAAIDELLFVLQLLFIILLLLLLLLARQGGPTFSLLSRLLSPSRLNSRSDPLPALSMLLSRSMSSSISEPEIIAKFKQFSTNVYSLINL